VTKRYRFDVFNFAAEEEFVDTNGCNGTTALSGPRIMPGKRAILGSVTMQPTTSELADIMAWAFGAPTANVYPLTDIRLTRYVNLDTVVKRHKMESVGVDRLTFRGSGDGEQKLEVTLDLCGIDEDFPLDATAFPTLSLDESTFPLLFNMLALTVNTHSYYCRDAELVFDFNIDKTRFLNSRTLTIIKAGGPRHVGVHFTLPWGDAYPDYGVGVGGMSATGVFTYGGASLTLAYNDVKFPRRGPQIAGRGSEIFQRMIGAAYKDSSTLECVPTLIVGP
jgi:hypothetical protein